MRRVRRFLPVTLVALLAVACLYIIWPSAPREFLPAGIPWPAGKGIKLGSFERRTLRLGLDLQGGTRLLLRAEVPQDFQRNIDDALEGTIRVLRKRVDASGVAEAEISRQGDKNLTVQLPGLTPQRARSLLGRTAQLRFCEPAGTNAADVGLCDESGKWQQATGDVDGQRIALTGRFLKSNAFVQFDQAGRPGVGFEFQDNGGEVFQQVTSRRIGQQIAIFLDNEQLSAPVVQAVISDRGSITGLTLERAQELVVQLNAGALPLQLTVLQEQNVDATLGKDSVHRSVLAGQIGLLLVALFMILYYRFPGVIATLALMVYTLISIALFKLIPVTLTLAGIGAFVLSIGMAVDANILIFERMKEELRAGRSYAASIDAGFSRAWPSIRDSNVSTLITCGVLYVLGGGFELPFLGTFDAPLVQGFAFTLAVGVAVSMFSAIRVTQILLHLFVGTGISRRHDWFVPEVAPPPAPEGARP